MNNLKFPLSLDLFHKEALFWKILFFLFSLIFIYDSSHAGEWEPFIWARSNSSEFGTDKGAILLPIKIDNYPFLMQLDTGAGTSILYRSKLPNKYSEMLTSSSIFMKRFSFSSRTFSHHFNLLYEQQAPDSQDECKESDISNVVGTVGDDLLRHGSLILDLENSRYQFRPGPFLHFSPVQAKVMPITFKSEAYAIPTLTASFPNGNLKTVLLDTGNAASDISIFHREDWLQLVNLQNLEQAKPFPSIRWGHPVSVYRAPIASDFSVGGEIFRKGTLATYTIDDIESTETWAEFGSIGLAHLSDDILILDYVSKKLIIKSSKKIKETTSRLPSQEKQKIVTSNIKEFVGSYLLADGQTLEVQSKNGFLEILSSEGNGVDAYQVARDVFLTNQPDRIEFSFKRDDALRVTSVAVHSNCRSINLEKTN